MAFKDILWFLPFVFFIAGYASLSILYQPKNVLTPSLVGISIQEALAIASSNGLNLQLLEQRENSELPEGTVISQNPAGFTAVKPNQTIFCTVSKQPIVTLSNFVGKSHEEALNKLKECSIHGKCYLLESNYPKGQCLAQSPQPQANIETKTVTLYISSGEHRPVLFPNLKNKPVTDVIDFLKPYNITPTIVHGLVPEPHQCNSSCTISDQRPVPGTLVILNPEKPIQVQLQVLYQPNSEYTVPNSITF